MRPDLRALGIAAGALLAGLLVLTLGLSRGGIRPVAALGALGNGAFGSWDAFTGGTLVRAVPLILIGLGFALALRGGALNIGAEGQFYLGAIAATWVGVHAVGWPGWIALPAVAAAGIVAGALWMVVPVILRLRFGVLEVISTLLLNFVADALVSLMVLGPMQEPSGIYPQSAPIAPGARLPLLPGTRLHAGFLVALLTAARPLVDLRPHLVGVPSARARDRSPGRRGERQGAGRGACWRRHSSDPRRWPGLAGAFEVSGVSYALYQNLSPGYGFTAIAVALLARLRPSAIILTGILFGALEVGAGAMQRDAGIPAVAVYVVEAVIILVLLLGEAATRRRLRRPSAVDVAEGAPVMGALAVTADVLAAAVGIATPLALAAIGETITERSGVVNLGIEGAMLFGALGGAIGATLAGPAAGLGLGMMAGILVAALFAAVAIGAGADQIITGAAVTLASVGLTGTIYRQFYGAGGVGLSIPTLSPIPIPGLAGLPLVGGALFDQPATTYFMALAIPVTVVAALPNPRRPRAPSRRRRCRCRAGGGGSGQTHAGDWRSGGRGVCRHRRRHAGPGPGRVPSPSA